MIKVLTLKDFKVSAWSGGTTTQLFIYPTTANYAERNFIFRLSTATVDVNRSDFTVLPDVTRYIMPLTSPFTLTHDGNPPVFLEVTKPHKFDGGAKTVCEGSGKDFNLMLKSADGNMLFTDKITVTDNDFCFVYAQTDLTAKIDFLPQAKTQTVFLPTDSLLVVTDKFASITLSLPCPVATVKL